MPTAELPEPDAASAIDDDAPAAAAIVHAGDVDVDALLADVARRLAGVGRRVRGVVMTHPDGRGRDRADGTGAMVLVDVHAGERFVVSQALGAGSRGCRADPRGFARASRVLRDALSDHAEVVVVNRFGKLEADGDGFAHEMLALMAAGVPLLTAVAPQHLGAWAAFTGGAARLDANAAAVERWLAGRLAPAEGITRP